ncbi:DUF4383 domain-containing protein [Nocardia altamirensis]|uniref:DUF4383 domain-containing protein n=1 Tax=Nocardia altamirensis TaxID=472158 RepID=UPI00143561EB|nr:DUF4383 domain-containing protein [Nocardia altamirensis]
MRRILVAYIHALTDSPVQFGVFIMAAWFTSNGPAAYLTCTSMLFNPVQPCTTQVLGFIPVTVNLLHTLCHLNTGIIGLVAVLRRSSAITYALIGAAYYIAWGILGLVGGADIRYYMGVDAFGSWVHIVEGTVLVLLWAGDRFSRRHAAHPNTQGDPSPVVTLFQDGAPPPRMTTHGS